MPKRGVVTHKATPYYLTLFINQFFINMKLSIYNDWSEEVIDKKAEELNAAFNKEIVELYGKAARGLITDYDEMQDKIFDISRKYAPQLCDMGKLTFEEELTKPYLEALASAKDHKSLQDHALLWIEICGVVAQSHAL